MLGRGGILLCPRGFPAVTVRLKLRDGAAKSPCTCGLDSEIYTQLPTKEQMDEFLKAAKHLEQMVEQVGKPKEKRFSLPSISLPSLEFPHLSPTLLLIPVVLFVLWTMWYSLDTLWNVIRMLNR